MAEVIRMPLLSDTMTEGKIVTWNKKVGDKVKADDVLADVETDKATMEVNGYVDGTLLYIGVPAGQAAKINQIIAIIGKEGEDFKSLLEEEPATPTTDNGPQTTEGKTKDEGQKTEVKAEQPTTNTQQPSSAAAKVSLPEGAKDIRMPLLSDTMTEGKIVSWNKKVGDKVKADDVLADVETDKATMEVVGYEEGTLLYIGVEAGKAAKINQIIAIVGKPGTDVSAYVAAEASGANAATTTDKGQTTIEGKTKDEGQTFREAAMAEESQREISTDSRNKLQHQQLTTNSQQPIKKLQQLLHSLQTDRNRIQIFRLRRCAK
jgi:pyruvate dehydrogenase E2 component (dihydrolipoamide acetyltransferase)